MSGCGPIPPYFQAGDTGELMIGGSPVSELIAEAGGTPLFVYDRDIIGGQLARLRAAMPDGLSIYYSVSANPYEPLLEFLGRYVEGFRVVSGGELDRLKRAHLAGIPMTFAGPGKSDAEFDAGIAAGATISVESEGEARRAILAGQRCGVRPRLAVRVNPPFAFDCGTIRMGAQPNPFGVDAERVPALIRGLIDADVDWRGLHVFAATQCLDHESLITAHRAIVGCAGEIGDAIGIPIPELNLGGGFDIPCFEGEQPLDVYALAKALHETVCNGPELLATTRLSLELGRWLVAESGVYLSRIIDRNESCGKTFVTTDGGGHHLLRATGCLHERAHGNFPIAIANKYAAEADETVTVTGCLATPHDMFGENVRLPSPDVGDVIATFCAGAYGLSASPQGWESRPAAREMLV